jgi:vacuolar-type H+-ATPase subunit F/Vma7
MLVVGDARDVRGFRLIGVPSVMCRDRREIVRALESMEGAATSESVLLVSATVYRLAPELFQALHETVRGPIVLRLPEDEGRRA